MADEQPAAAPPEVMPNSGPSPYDSGTGSRMQ